jgi:Cu/Ag efflux pump CusA
MVARGAQERMAPVLVTALATAVAVAPFAIAGDRPGLELISAIAITMLGGLVTTTLVNLVLLPSLYLWIARGSAAPAVSPGESSIAMERPGATAD